MALGFKMALGFRIKWLLEEYKQTSLAPGVWSESEPQAQCVRRVFIFQGSGRARRARRGPALPPRPWRRRAATRTVVASEATNHRDELRPRAHWQA